MPVETRQSQAGASATEHDDGNNHTSQGIEPTGSEGPLTGNTHEDDSDDPTWARLMKLPFFRRASLERQEEMYLREREREDREREREHLEKREEREREDREKREGREHELRMKEMELRVTGGRDPETVRTRVSIPDWTEKTRPEQYFGTCEKLFHASGIPKTQSVGNLVHKLSEKARAVYAALPLESANDYDVLKRAILDDYKILPEVYRRIFFTWVKRPQQSYLEYIKTLREQLEFWVGTKDLQSVDWVSLMLRYRLDSQVNQELSLFLIDKKPKTLDECVELADQYVLSRKLVERNYSGAIKRRDERPTQTQSSDNVTRNSGVGSNRSTGERPTQSNTQSNTQVKFCDYCQKRNHTQAECFFDPTSPRYRGPRPQSGSTRSDSIELNADCVHSTALATTIMYGSDEKILNPVYNNYSGDALITGAEPRLKFPVTYLRDTGPTCSILCSDAVPKSQLNYTGDRVALRGINSVFSLTPNLHSNTGCPPSWRTSKMAESKPDKRPSYFDSLDSEARTRYLQKLSLINGQDPYTISSKDFSGDPGIIPSVTYPDIVNYLVYSPSPYTLEDLRCYKGLDAYNQFVSGWVRDVTTTTINDLRVVVGRVLHSQRPRETPLKPWLIIEKSGKVLAGHCNCMAGLGEACTHVSATLFYLETKVRIRDSKTVTQEAAYWKLPNGLREIHYRPAYQIDFTSAKSKKKQLDSLVNDNTALTPGKRKPKETVPPTAEEVSNFFTKQNIAGSKAAVLAIVPGTSERFTPITMKKNFPPVLNNLYCEDHISLTFNELLAKCDDVTVEVNREQAKTVEEATRKQSANNLWFRFRAGRITASKARQVCVSNPDQPSQSLVKAICYPQACKFSNNATKWGCEHEETALAAYKERMETSHENFNMTESGFVINPSFPFIGATPDARVNCDCCGSGVVEVKCPYCAQDRTVDEYASDRVRSCLSKDSNGVVHLRTDHAYMFQVQTQIYVCEVDFADFVVWTTQDVHVERLEGDETLWEKIVNSSEMFFRKAVLPKLLAKFYSRPVLQEVPEIMASTTAPTDNNPVFCYCSQPEEFGDMIACDNENCSIQWFHIDCLKIKRVPKGKWFCPDCRKLQKSKRKCADTPRKAVKIN